MNKILKPLVLLMVVLLLGILGVLGCTGAAGPMGWSGAAVAGDSLFVGSMTGKLVALSASNGVHLVGFEDYAVTATVGGGFGCGPSTVAVPIYGTPVASGDWVYFPGYNGRVYSINAATGKERWFFPAEGNVQAIVGGVTLSGDRLFFATVEGRVYCLDTQIQQNDREIWDFLTGDKIWSTPVVSGDTVYVGSFDKKLYAINADGTKKWEFAAEGAIVASPVVYNNTVYVGSFDRHLYAINLDGSLKWKSDFIAGKWFWASVVVSGDAVYAPSLDGKVYILNANTGEKMAEVDLGAPVSSSPVASGSLVIVATEKGTVYAIDTASKDARLIATLKTAGGDEEVINAPLCAAGGVVYVHTQSQPGEAVYALSPETGQILWSVTIR